MKQENSVVHQKITVSILGIALLLPLLSGCGKHEAAGSMVGTGAGAIIGTAVAGRNSKGTGALLGGLIGNIVGGGMGRAADAEEQEEAQMRKDARHRQNLAELHAENRRLRDKWCRSCCVQVTIDGARSCPRCGDELIREKYCTSCSTIYSAKSGYRFCLYCREKTVLASR